MAPHPARLARTRLRAGPLAAASLLALAACSAPTAAPDVAGDRDRDAAAFSDPAFDREAAEAAVWSAVEARNATWLADDFAGHMALYHPDFRRWSLHAPRLMTKDGFAGLWSAIKANEAVRTLDVEPAEVVFYADGAVAIAHYTIRESWEWIGADQTAEQGREARTGDVMTGALRFSDVWVREGGAWLYAGGHRDAMSLEE